MAKFTYVYILHSEVDPKRFYTGCAENLRARLVCHNGGKEIRRSLGTTDPALARRNLTKLRREQSQIDRSKSRLTLFELCETYLKTIQHQKAETIERKTYIVNRIMGEWPGGAKMQLGKVKPSDVQLWLARYNFGPVSRNLHLACIKEIFHRRAFSF